MLEPLHCGCSKLPFGLWLPLHFSAFQEAIRSGVNYFWKLGNVAKGQQEGRLLGLHPVWLWGLGLGRPGRHRGAAGTLVGLGTPREGDRAFQKVKCQSGQLSLLGQWMDTLK